MTEKKDLTSIFDTQFDKPSEGTEAPSLDSNDSIELNAIDLQSGNEFPVSESSSPQERSSQFQMPISQDLDRLDNDIAAAAPSEALPLSAPAQPDTLSELKSFSENLSVSGEKAAPAYPFHLLIDGELDVHDRTRILDLLTRHDFGIREVDLEPQLEAGRVLIPRISEYAVVLMTQALRNSKATLYAFPSDEAAENEALVSRAGVKVEISSHHSHDEIHPALSIPVTQDHRIAGTKTNQIVDVIVTSASLKAASLDFEHSAEYNALLDSLKTELQYRAYRKGANGVVNFKVAISYSDATNLHKILVTGTAIKTVAQSN